MKIAHAFIHEAVESEYLKQFGEIHGYGLKINQHVNLDRWFECDLRENGLETQYDLGLFHPPCQKWARATNDKSKYENLIPRARELAKQHCNYWIIENVKGAPLKDPVILNGAMFERDLKYERAFETNFEIEEPEHLGKFYYGASISEMTQFRAGQIKGYSPSYYTAETVTRNCVPSYYLEYILSHCPIIEV